MSILFRRNVQPIPFRDALLELIKSEGKGDCLILSYGYATPGIIDNDFKVSIYQGLPLGGTLNLLGVHDRPNNKFHKQNQPNISYGRFNVCSESSCGYCNYLKFIVELEKEFNHKITVNAYLIENFHAKVAIKLRNNYPIAVITGSSNLSKATYSLNTSYINYECDIYMLDDDIIQLSGFVDTKARQEKLEFDDETPTYERIIKAFETRSYALEVIPVDSKIPDKNLMERLYDEIKYFINIARKI
jgi:hypothetical protein